MPIEQVDYKENKEKTLASLDEYTIEVVPNLVMRYEEVSFIYKENGVVLGSIVGNIHWDHLTVELFFVSKNTQGKGIGSKLLANVEKIALERKCSYIILETMSFNAPAFYKKNGYQIIAQIENSPLEGETRYFMKKELQ